MHPVIRINTADDQDDVLVVVRWQNYAKLGYILPVKKLIFWISFYRGFYGLDWWFVGLAILERVDCWAAEKNVHLAARLFGIGKFIYHWFIFLRIIFFIGNLEGDQHFFRAFLKVISFGHISRIGTLYYSFWFIKFAEFFIKNKNLTILNNWSFCILLLLKIWRTKLRLKLGLVLIYKLVASAFML